MLMSVKALVLILNVWPRVFRSKVVCIVAT